MKLTKVKIETSQLFLVCPFTMSEHVIRNHFGDQCYFMSAPGGVFRLHELDYREAFEEFLDREMITELAFVHDVSCPIIQRILTRKARFGIGVEAEIEELYIEHFKSINALPTITDQSDYLAEKLLIKQLSEFYTYFESRQVELQLTGIICNTKSLKILKQIKFPL